MTDINYTQTDADLAEHLPDGRDPDVAWLLIPAERERVEPYLYSHAVIVSSTPGEGYGPLTLVVVCGRAGRSDVGYQALYQADRLRSGLMGVWVFDTYNDAYKGALRFHSGEDVA